MSWKKTAAGNSQDNLEVTQKIGGVMQTSGNCKNQLPKSPKVAQCRPKSPKVAQGRPKSSKVAQCRPKSPKVARVFILMIYLMYWIYLMSFIYIIHLMCWNYLIDLIDLVT